MMTGGSVVGGVGVSVVLCLALPVAEAILNGDLEAGEDDRGTVTDPPRENDLNV